MGRKCPQRSDRRKISHLDKSGETFGTKKSRHHACLQPKEILPPLQRSTFLTRRVDAKRHPISTQRRCGGDRKYDSRFAINKSKISDRIISGCRLKFQEPLQQSGNVKVSISYPPTSESKVSRKIDTMKLRPLSFKERTKTDNLLMKRGAHVGSPYSILCYNSDRSQSAKAAQIGISPQSSLGSVEAETDLTENKAKIPRKLVSGTLGLKCEVKGEKAIVYEKRSGKSDSKHSVKFSDDCAEYYQTIIPPIPGDKSPCSTLEELGERNAILLSSSARRPETNYTDNNVQQSNQHAAILNTILNSQIKEENKIGCETLSNKSSYVITTKEDNANDMKSLSESRREENTADLSQDQSVHELSESDLTEGALASSEGETLYDSLNATLLRSIASTETPQTDIDKSERYEDLVEDKGEQHPTEARINETREDIDFVKPFTAPPLGYETIGKESAVKSPEVFKAEPHLQSKDKKSSILDHSFETGTCRLSPKTNTKRKEIARRQIKEGGENKYSSHPDIDNECSIHQDSKMSQTLVSKDQNVSIHHSSDTTELSTNDSLEKVDAETSNRSDVDEEETTQRIHKDVLNQKSSISNQSPEYGISNQTKNSSLLHFPIASMQDDVTKIHDTLTNSIIKESSINLCGEDPVSAIPKIEIVSNDVTDDSIKTERLDQLEVTSNVDNMTAVPFKSSNVTGFKKGNSPSTNGVLSSEGISQSSSNQVTVVDKNLINNASSKLSLNLYESKDATGMIPAENNVDNTEPVMERIPSDNERHSLGETKDSLNLVVVSNANDFKVGSNTTTISKTPDLQYTKESLEPCKDRDIERYQLPGKEVVSFQRKDGERRSVIRGSEEETINTNNQVQTSGPNSQLVPTNLSVLDLGSEKTDTEKLEDEFWNDDAVVVFNDKDDISSSQCKSDFESCQSTQQFAKCSTVIKSPNVSLRQLSASLPKGTTLTDSESQLCSLGINNAFEGDDGTSNGDDGTSDGLSNDHNIGEMDEVSRKEDAGSVERKSSTRLPIIYEDTTVMSVGTDEEKVRPAGSTHSAPKERDIVTDQTESMAGYNSKTNSGNQVGQLKERLDFGNSWSALAAESFDRAYQNMCVIRMMGQLIHKKAASILDRLYLNMENVAYSGRMTDQFYVTFLNSEQAQGLERETEEFAERLSEIFLNFHDIWTAEDAFVRCCEEMVHAISNEEVLIPSIKCQEQKKTGNGDCSSGSDFSDALS